MKAFVDWVLAQRARLIIVAVVAAPLLSVFSAALIALETARRGTAWGVVSGAGMVGGLAVLCRVAQASPTTQRLRFRDRDDLRAEARKLRLEQGRRSRRAADDDAIHTGPDELRNLVLRERMAGDRHERLGMPSRSVTESRRVTAGEDDRLHYDDTLVSGSAVSGNASNGELGRPIPS